MKKFLLLTSFTLTLLSCTNDLVFNDHAVQATKDNVYWKASEMGISLNEDGTMTLVASLNDQLLTFHLSGTEPGVYGLGEDSDNRVLYTDADLIQYSTLNNGDGEVVIERYNPIEQTYTGSFRFNAFSDSGDIVNFHQGTLYRVPLVNEIVEEGLGELRATVDDNSLDANEVLVINEDRIIQIKGIASDGSYITLYLPDNITTGSHNLNQQSSSGTYAVYGYADGTVTAAQFGTLFLNEHDVVEGRIRGSFTFTTLLPNSVYVDDGSFTAYY
jgi:hypothetical protein